MNTALELTRQWLQGLNRTGEFLPLLFSGPGKLSLDAWIARRYGLP